MEELTRFMVAFQEEYPEVVFDIYTATADAQEGKMVCTFAKGFSACPKISYYTGGFTRAATDHGKTEVSAK